MAKTVNESALFVTYAIRFTISIFDHSYTEEGLESSPDPDFLQLTSSQSFFVVSVHFQGNNSIVSIVKQDIVVCCRYLALKLSVKIGKMIPPNASLVKYDNPVLVSRNTDKKSPRVS